MQRYTAEVRKLTPEQEIAEKRKFILDKALLLKGGKGGYKADAREVIDVEEYRRVGHIGLDKEKLWNKFRAGWFSQVGLLMQEIQVLPDSDDFDGACEHLWVIKSVRDCFGDNENDFQDWLRPRFNEWKSRLVELRDEYMKMSEDSVKAGDKILDIIIGELNKPKN